MKGDKSRLYLVRIDEIPQRGNSILGNTPDLDERVVIPLPRRRPPIVEKGHAVLREDRRPPMRPSPPTPRLGEKILAVVAPPGVGERFYRAIVWCTAAEFHQLQVSLAAPTT